jgi:hypothetical protein
MNRKLIASIQIALGAAVLVAAASSKAFTIAFVERRFPGSACVKVGSAGTLFITTDGAVTNGSSSTMTVECPVLQNRLGHDGTGIDVQLWYLDHSTASIDCTYRAEPDDNVSAVSSSASSTHDANVYDKLTFTTFHFAGGFAHIRCTIPPPDASGNLSYIVGYSGY